MGKLAAAWAGRLAVCAVAMSLAGVTTSNSADGRGISKVRFGGDANETRVVVELDRAAKGRVVEDGGEGGVAVVLAGASAQGDLSGRGSGMVKAWAVDRAMGGARLRLQLDAPATIQRRFLLPPADGAEGYRYVIDLQALKKTAVSRSSKPAPVPNRVSAAPIRLKKVIVIDAGHGGKDPGARGQANNEKDLTLKAAKALKARLEKTGRYEVVLTRGSDTFIPLPTRVQTARRADADLFISLHADAGTDPSLRGLSVYTLSDSGSDRAARKAIEQRGYFLNVSLPGQDRAVNRILLDLTQRTTKNLSSQFAENLVGRFSGEGELLRRSHRSAGFVVLLAPDVPAVLLEMGFVTNPADEAKLADAKRRAKLMNTVAGAIDDFFAGQAGT
ncbi:MAG: N-acetylmuramoyl-L-alanine amidase family protein [Caulobacteraceae bacterium]